MTTMRHIDVIMEMIELCHEIVSEIRQQLIYYRASVYKEETGQQIDTKVAMLRLILETIPDECLHEPFLDFDAEAKNGIRHIVPGECSLSSRTTRLLINIEAAVNSFQPRAISSQTPEISTLDQKLRSKFSKRKQDLLTQCRPGSRQWNFLQRV